MHIYEFGIEVVEDRQFFRYSSFSFDNDIIATITYAARKTVLKEDTLNKTF